MRAGDKILVLRRLPLSPQVTTYTTTFTDEPSPILMPARVLRYSFDHGRRVIVYYLRGVGAISRGTLYGRDEGVKWVRGWDVETREAQALRTAVALG